MLKNKLLQLFSLLVLLVGGVSVLFGWRFLEKRVVAEAQKQVRLDLGGAWAILRSEIEHVQTIVKLTALKRSVVEAVSDLPLDDPTDLQNRLDLIQQTFGFDFLNLVAPDGSILASARAERIGRQQNSTPAVRRALAGEPAAGIELLQAEALEAESPALRQRALLNLEPTPKARPTERVAEDRGLVMSAAVPILQGSQVLGVVYGGVLINRNVALVDHIQETIYKEETYRNAPLGTATIFLEDVRIATTVSLPNGSRALGTRVSAEVAERVLDRELPWVGPAFVVKESYLTTYEPIRDLDGRVVGMLYVGRLERPLRDLQRTTLAQYGGLCLAGLVVAMVFSYVMAGRLSRPIHALVEASQRMHRGEPLDAVATRGSCHEIEALVLSFNEMAASLQERQARLNAANAELAAKSEALAALNRSYMDMLGYVSHELKSPVASMQNYAFLLSNEKLGPLTEKQRKAVHSIESGTNRLVEMVRHYLNLSRIENSDLTPLRTTVRLREDIVQPLVESLQADLQARRMRLHNDLPEHLELQADPNMLTEAFENLMGNAVKYGREGGAIRVSAEPEGDRLAFSVWNEGEGFREEDKVRLFKKFSRLPHPNAPHTRSTGLGLFITREIVEAHGGSIEARSAPGQWAEFRFRLGPQCYALPVTTS